MPKVAENLYSKKCPQCHNEVYYEHVPKKGWKPFGDAKFEVGDWYVNLVCPDCGWKINTSIQPKNVYQTSDTE